MTWKMTEEQWLISGFWELMHRHLSVSGRGIRIRKLRLFAAACRWRIWPLLSATGQRATELVELLADAQASHRELHDLLGRLPRPSARAELAARWALVTGKFVPEAIRTAIRHIKITGPPQEEKERGRIFRDIAGNPFRPIRFEDAWRTPSVRTVALAVYEERILPEGSLDPGSLAILSDALEEAGCTEQALVDHLRDPGQHVRGCWAVDLCLGRE
jgi:hypothetical protein